MVTHIVLLKFKEGTTEDLKSELQTGFKALEEAIPGIEKLSVGRNITQFNEGVNKDFDMILNIEFTDLKALEEYWPHPAHQAVSALAAQVGADDVLIVDYE